jgi:predicted transcriptional regulator
MPQSERSEILKKLLKWLIAQEKGATVQAILQYTKWEITEGGATDNAIKKYIDDLEKALLIEYMHPFWKITDAGKQWLEKHSI